MNRSPEVGKSNVAPELLDPPVTIRTETAGILGLTTCQFDSVTGEHVSTTRSFRSFEVRRGVLEKLGVVPGLVEERHVGCPFFDESKCESCPNKVVPLEDAEVEALIAQAQLDEMIRFSRF